MEDYHDKELLESKPVESYSKSLKDNLSIISIDPDNLHVYGTYSYKGQPYAGDVDLIERFSDCCNANDVVNKFVPRLKKTVKKIKDDKTVFFLEMKCGFDFRYLPYNVGVVADNELLGYDYNKLKKMIKDMYDKGLFNKEDMDVFNKHVKKNIDKKDFETILAQFRKYYQLRWQPDEIIEGIKILPKKKAIKLEDAILQISESFQTKSKSKEGNVIKIDMVGNVNGRFLEFSNLFMLRYIPNKNSKYEYDINLPERFDNIVEALRSEVEKWGFSPLLFKPFKMVKRLWVLARMLGDIAMNEKLEKLYRGGASLLSQISSEISAINFVLEQKEKKVPIKEIKEQIDSFKSRIVYNIDVPIELDKINKNIDEILKMKSYESIIEKLKNLKKYLDENITKYTLEYLKERQLYPPPKKYLPQ